MSDYSELDEGVFVSGGGMCPVQFNGTIDDQPFYFRARHSSWCLTIATKDPVGAFLDEPEDTLLLKLWAFYGDPDDTHGAGYMPLEEAENFIKIGAQEYRNGKRGVHQINLQPVEDGIRLLCSAAQNEFLYSDYKDSWLEAEDRKDFDDYISKQSPEVVATIHQRGPEYVARVRDRYKDI